MCHCPVVALPLGCLTHPTKLTWWLPHQGQNLFLTLAADSRDTVLPRALAAAALQLKLMRNLEGMEERMEGIEVVDTDVPAGYL